jgi:hypothetical protein
MKTTKILRALYVLIFAILLSINFSCAGFLNAELDGDIPMKDGFPDMEKIQEKAIEDFKKNLNGPYYTQNFLEASAGLGYDSTEDDSEFSYCLGVGYNYRISEDNFNKASFVNGSVTHHASSADDRDFNLTRFGVGFTQFDNVSYNGKLDFTYGLDASYGIGSRENFGFKDDLTEIRFGLDFGINYSVSPNLDLGLTVPVATWSEQTFESGDFEIKQEHTWVGLNKNNMVMAYARIKLD